MTDAAKEPEAEDRKTALDIMNEIEVAGPCDEHGRYACRPCTILMITAALSAVRAQMQARVDALRHRLEIDREWREKDGVLVEVSADLPESCDGISCRDETIKLQDEQIEQLTSRTTAAEAALERAKTLFYSLTKRASPVMDADIADDLTRIESALAAAHAEGRAAQRREDVEKVRKWKERDSTYGDFYTPAWVERIAAAIEGGGP